MKSMIANATLTILLFATVLAASVTRIWLSNRSVVPPTSSQVLHNSLIKRSTCPQNLLVPPKHSKLEFIHIPKTGGTTMEVVAASHNVPWGACHWLPSVEAPNGKCPREHNRQFFHHPDLPPFFSSWHVPIQYYNTPKHPNLFQWYRNASLFTIVRNPYHRMVSEWNYGSKSIDHNDALRMNEYLSRTISNLQLAVDKPEYKWWQQGDHWVRQIEFVSNIQMHGGPDHVYILHYEDLANEFACLMHTFDMNWTWPSQKTNSARGHLTAANLTEETKQHISQYYALDFETFGYDTHAYS
jgi:hypothetical protein